MNGLWCVEEAIRNSVSIRPQLECYRFRLSITEESYSLLHARCF